MFFGVSEPTDDASWNYYLLYNLSFVKHCIIGVFYIHKLRYYGPVLDLDQRDLEQIDKSILFPIKDEHILNGLLIICKRCGWCCAEEAGSFLFEHELEQVENFIGKRIKNTLKTQKVKLYNGKTVRIYLLEKGKQKTCMFYDQEKRACTIHPVKPIICVVTYCARFAIDRLGRQYIRVGARRPDGAIVFIRTLE